MFRRFVRASAGRSVDVDKPDVFFLLCVCADVQMRARMKSVCPLVCGQLVRTASGGLRSDGTIERMRRRRGYRERGRERRSRFNGG